MTVTCHPCHPLLGYLLSTVPGSDLSLISVPAPRPVLALPAFRPWAASSATATALLTAGAAAAVSATPPTGATAAAHPGTPSLAYAAAAGVLGCWLDAVEPGTRVDVNHGPPQDPKNPSGPGVCVSSWGWTFEWWTSDYYRLWGRTESVSVHLLHLWRAEFILFFLHSCIKFTVQLVQHLNGNNAENGITQ